MLKSAKLLHKCDLGDSDMSSTVAIGMTSSCKLLHYLLLDAAAAVVENALRTVGNSYRCFSYCKEP